MSSKKLTEEWKTSSRSGEGSACVEARAEDGAAQVRDSKDRTGPVLTFGATAWEQFLDEVRTGRFDL